MTKEGAPVRVMTGGGPRCSAPRALLLKSYRDVGLSCGARPGCGCAGCSVAPARLGGGRTRGGALRFRLAVRGTKRCFGRRCGSDGRKAGYRFCPRENGSLVQIPSLPLWQTEFPTRCFGERGVCEGGTLK